jgi:hypothetical protein
MRQAAERLREEYRRLEAGDGHRRRLITAVASTQRAGYSRAFFRSM